MLDDFVEIVLIPLMVGCGWVCLGFLLVIYS